MRGSGRSDVMIITQPRLPPHSRRAARSARQRLGAWLRPGAERAREGAGVGIAEIERDVGDAHVEAQKMLRQLGFDRVRERREIRRPRRRGGARRCARPCRGPRRRGPWSAGRPRSARCSRLRTSAAKFCGASASDRVEQPRQKIVQFGVAAIDRQIEFLRVEQRGSPAARCI